MGFRQHRALLPLRHTINPEVTLGSWLRMYTGASKHCQHVTCWDFIAQTVFQRIFLAWFTPAGVILCPSGTNPQQAWLWLFPKQTCIYGCLLSSSLKDLCAGWLLSAVLLSWQRHQGNVWKFLSPLWAVLLNQQPSDPGRGRRSVNTHTHT